MFNALMVICSEKYRIEGGTVEQAAVQGTPHTNVFTVLGINDNVIIRLYRSLHTRINNLPVDTHINIKANYILHDMIHYVRNNNERPDRLVRRIALVRIEEVLPTLDNLNDILNEGDKRQQFLNIFYEYQNKYDPPAAE